MDNDQQPIFSVVIPVYNVERYIKKSLDSVLAQTFADFEIVVVNDGSTDRSIELVEEYCDQRIRIVHQKNRGLSAARNTGINASRGEFIALLDSDDFWAREKLQHHFAHFRSKPDVDISYSSSLFVDEEGTHMGIGQYPKLEDITPAHIFCRNPVGNGSAAVISRAFLNRIKRIRPSNGAFGHQYFDESLRQSEDIEFWLRAALDADAKFEGLAGAFTCYRVNGSGLSANLDKQFNAWKHGMNTNRANHPKFFKQWYSLAKAYQQRYLARRAIQSGDSVAAFRWLHRALKSDQRILLHEPARTVFTYAVMICCFLPASVYRSIERIAVNSKSSYSQG